MIIDAHVHAYTKERINELLLSMKKNKIEKSIILYWPGVAKNRPQPKPFFQSPPFKDVLERIKKYKNLFLAGSIRITDTETFDDYFKELENAIVNKNIVAVKLYLGYEHFFANDSRCDKIYELCLKYKIPVIFHTGDTYSIKDALVRFANPIYLDDVAVKFPNLKIVIAHLGNPIWIKETTEVIYKNKNVFADISGTLSLSRRFEKEENNNLKEEILKLVYYIGSPRKLIFGSDFPLYRQEQYIEFLDDFQVFSKLDMDYIKYKNAEKIFRI